MQSSPSVNLAKRKTTIVDDVIKWALTGGRLLVIFVEIVAFSAFVYRFTLDRQITDLNDDIKGKQNIVASLEERESLYRNIHSRIALVKELTGISDYNILILNDIINSTPPDISFNSFNIDGNQISINATIGSVSSLTSFVEFLREHPEISSASITNIENSTQVGEINSLIVVKLKGVN